MKRRLRNVTAVILTISAMLFSCFTHAQESEASTESVASLDVYSGSWYDPAHDGEGWIVEVLDEHSAVIYWFTYDPDGNQSWLVGVVDLDGNTLAGELLIASGAVFGPDFDPADVSLEPWGNVSLRLDDCQSGALEYVSYFPEYGSGSLQPQRLVNIDGLNCELPSNPVVSRFSGWTGSWYDPSHDGEGWIIETINEDTAVIYWFTYDSMGDQAWLTGVAQRNGNRLKADMLVTSGASFGPEFDPADVELLSWGSLEITFADCNAATAVYDSELVEFGSGSLLPQRLTTLDGLDCAEAPNILMIIADDFGLDAFSVYDISPEQPATPVLAELADQGLVFDQFWSSPTCSPTRSALLTGLHGVRTGVLLPGDYLDDSYLSVHDHLEQNLPGYYANAVIGKWHLSGPNDSDHPARLGVQHFAGNLSPMITSYSDWTLTVNAQESESTEYMTSKFVDLSLDWVGQQTQPWFLWLAMTAPHEPLHLPPTALHSRDLSGTPGDIEDNPLPYYLAMIEAIDTEVGRLLQGIDPLVLKNTLIVFLGDNGTQRSLIQSPYRRTQGKGSLYQGGINVPLFVSGAGVARAGEREQALVGATDLFATIAELAGSGGEIQNDSVGFSSLFATAGAGGRSLLYTDARDEDGLQSWAVRNQRYKLIADQQGRQEVYDLQLDPLESTDLIIQGTAPVEDVVELQQAAAAIRQQ